jgi:SAM-dependent methyltransferase
MAEVLSFRDPSGECFAQENRFFRNVKANAAATLERFLKSPLAQGLMDRRELVTTRKLGEEEAASLKRSPEPDTVIFEHERVAFPSYAHEWPAEMLHAGASLTLDMAERALQDGFGLKDATPHNVLFRGPKPVFVDLLSFEPRKESDPIWTPYGQFIRTFLLPLLAHKYFGMRLTDIFTTHRDGLEPEEVYRWCGVLQRFRPTFLSLVSAPTWMSRKSQRENTGLYRERVLRDPAKARFILECSFRSLRRKLESLRPPKKQSSVWSDYMRCHSYSGDTFAAKERFVTKALAEVNPKSVLDMGANTGHFSRLAAQTGAAVVAVDSDASCVGEIWRNADEAGSNILPLVIDLGRPSAALGWRNRECASFLSRAQGQFDAVLMLAVLHHLLVSERIPLNEVIDLAAELTRDALVIEFIGLQDPMFQQLTRGRDHLHAAVDMTAFETAARRHFHMVRCERLGETHRWLYFLRKKSL